MESEIKTTPKSDSLDGIEDKSRLDKPLIAQRLKAAIAAGGGNKKVASRTGIPLSTINNYTTGESEPKLSAAALISSACNISLNWLAHGDGPRNCTDAPPADSQPAKSETKPLTQITLAVYDSIYESGKLVTPENFGSLLASFYNFYKEMDGGGVALTDEVKWQRLKELLAIALKASRE